MWETTPENEVVDDSALDEKMLSLVEKECGKKPIRLNELQALFFDTYGVICSTKHLSSAKSGSVLKRLEQEGKIAVKREPEKTKTGSASTFWSENAKQKIYIMRK